MNRDLPSRDRSCKRFDYLSPKKRFYPVTPQVSPKAPRSKHDLQMQESLVTVDESGQWTLHYGAEGDGSNTYQTLSELVCCDYRLQIPYSNIPKAGQDDDSVHTS